MSVEQNFGMRDRIRQVLSIDLRSMALFRVAMSSVLLFDLVSRWLNVRMLYTDQGIMPRAGLIESFGPYIPWTTLHYHTSGSVGLQSALFVVAVFCAVGLLVGFRTWLMTLLSWVLLVSLHRRLPYIEHGGDLLLRVMLFWGLFLPLGARWSVDSGRSSSIDDSSNRFFSVATAGTLLQVCYVYWFTVILKWHPDWLQGRALGIALGVDFYAKPLGTWVAKHRELTVFMNYSALVIEAVVPCIVLSPYRRPFLRWVGILSMWGLHIGIALCMRVGIFSYISMSIWLLFIPTESWDALFRWLRSRRASGIDSAIPRTGFLGLEKTSLGKYASIPRLTPSVTGSVLAALLLCLITVYNVLGLDQLKRRGVEIPRPVKLAAKVLRTEQRWAMFAPTPENWNGWFVMPARLQNGSRVDIWLGNEPPTTDRPDNPGAAYPNIMVKRFMTGRRKYAESPAWLWFARYMAREWNASHPPDEAIERLRITFVGYAPSQPTPFLTHMVEYDVTLDQLVSLPKVPE